MTDYILDHHQGGERTVNEQLNQTLTGQGLAVFKRLRAALETAVCTALRR